MDSGSALPSLSRDHFYGVPLDLPPLEEQERIAGVLGAFDDLIETNRRLADQLDEVRVARVSAALAESTFETRLTDIAAFVNGRNFTKGADGGGRPVIRTPEVRSGPGGNTVWNSVEADDDRIARAGDILFVWSGTLMVNRWLYMDGLVNQHVFKVVPHGVPAWCAYALIEAQLSWFLGLAKDKATTMGHIQRAHLDEPVIGLNDAAIQRLNAVVEPMWSGALELRREAQNLARQRDELLPLLMSGKVRVRDVEASSESHECRGVGVRGLGAGDAGRAGLAHGTRAGHRSRNARRGARRLPRGRPGRTHPGCHLSAQPESPRRCRRGRDQDRRPPRVIRRPVGELAGIRTPDTGSPGRVPRR
jgi:type I restriction enzyme S subunit